MEGLKIIVCFVFQLWCARSSVAFLLSGTSCPVRHPCHCAGPIADCSYLKLRTLPAFYAPATQPSSIIFWIDGNELKNIPANAFQSLASLNGTSVHIEAADNRISYIDDNAFAGVEHLIIQLGLAGNKLRSLPNALATLHTLRVLDITANPLRTLDASVLRALSGTLTYFRFRVDQFDEFPKELSLLTSLESLILDGLNVPIADDVFDGFKHSLKMLQVEQSVYNPPTAVCRLEVLESFFFDRNFRDPDGNLSGLISSFPPCNNTLPSVTSLILEEVNLRTFSSHVFAVFPSLSHLNVEANVRFVDNRDIPLRSQLTILYMNNNELTSVPGALSVLSNLTELYLTGNQIQEIIPWDLSALTKLQVLDLSGNPIYYIADDAFVGNPNLRVLFLNENYLKAIPAAVTSLTSLSTLHLDDNRIKCDCATMSNVTTWNVDALAFPGACYHNHNNTIKAYIQHSLPQCP